MPPAALPSFFLMWGLLRKQNPGCECRGASSGALAGGRSPLTAASLCCSPWVSSLLMDTRALSQLVYLSQMQTNNYGAEQRAMIMTENREGIKLLPCSPGSLLAKSTALPKLLIRQRCTALPVLPLGLSSTECPLWTPSKCSCKRQMAIALLRNGL